MYFVWFHECARGSAEETGIDMQQDGRMHWREGFSMLKAVQIRHPQHVSEMIRLHPPGEHDLEVTLQLEKEDEILGFQVREARAENRKDPFVVPKIPGEEPRLWSQ